MLKRKAIPYSFQNILCAIDFSDFTPQMIHYGVGFAKRFDARLLVFHSIPIPTDFLYNPSFEGKEDERVERAKKATNRIKSFMQSYKVSWEPVVVVGDPVETAAAAAKDKDIDLVMAASHRMSAFKRFLFGTIVERMARDLTSPFFVVRPPKLAHQLDLSKSLTVEKIVVACDLTDNYQTALILSQYVARTFQAEIHLLHTMESPVHELRLEEVTGHYHQVQDDLMVRLQNRMENLIPKASGLNIKTILKSGIPGECLLSYAREQKADVVVVGIRAHGTLEKILVGSTTEAVLRHSPCPVLVVTQSDMENQECTSDKDVPSPCGSEK